MKQALQINLGQHLTLTPQLQQAIRLLQLSSIELEHEIQEVLNSNLMLERSETAEQDKNVEKEASSETDSTHSDENHSEDMSVETNWDDPLQQTLTGTKHNSEASNSDSYLRETTTLHDFLYWQMRLTPFSKTDEMIAYAIIDAINDDGFLNSSLEDLQTGLQKNIPNIELDEIEAVLKLIQHFEPVGVGARDVRESLLIQLHQLPSNTLWIKEATALVDSHLDLLAHHNYKQLQRMLKIDEESLKEVIHLIRSLSPHPGSSITPEDTHYVIPDILVKRVQNRWVVELNSEALPHVRINRQYAALIERANSSSSNQLLKNHLQEARWFLKSLQSRNETLLKVATCIIEHQRDFLEHGEEAMKPLVLHEIAQAVGMHESTISRVTTQKYMHTPRGIFELKYFFSSHVDTQAGGECSATAIRALIKKLIGAENPSRPLSDNKIAQLLGKQGICVARRTVAKYREAMTIPPSHERKSL